MFFAAHLWGYTVAEVLIACVVIAACVAIAYVAMRQFGVTPPPWAVQIFWVVVVAVVAILAIRVVVSL